MVNSQLSEPNRFLEGGESDNRSAPSSYEEAFNLRFPYYLSIGMTEEQYWDKDCMLVKYYRQADELRKERVNQEMWLQGMYIYDAVSRLSPIFNSFAKTKPKPYVEEPYPINQKTAEESKVRKDKALVDKGLRYMQAYMDQNNKGFNKKDKERK